MQPQTWELLKKYNIAYVNVDEPLLPSDIHLTTDFAYFRWHGHGKNPWFDYKYTKSQLEAWVPKIEKAAKETKKIVGYFNNHYHGYAPENCLYLIEKLRLLTQEQKNQLKKTHKTQLTLGSYLEKSKRE